MRRFELESLDDGGPIVVSRLALADQRGSLSRLFCANDLREVFLNKELAQINHTITHKAGTVRGFHYQTGSSAEAKMVICVKGRVIDVAVDLREKSENLCKSYSVELSAENLKALFIPRGFAHGFQALEDDTELIYLHDNFYDPLREGGISIYDPRLNFQWPMPVLNVSERDANFNYLSTEFEGFCFEM